MGIGGGGSSDDDGEENDGEGGDDHLDALMWIGMYYAWGTFACEARDSNRCIPTKGRSVQQFQLLCVRAEEEEEEEEEGCPMSDCQRGEEMIAFLRNQLSVYFHNETL